jgi:hypothetical protein
VFMLRSGRLGAAGEAGRTDKPTGKDLNPTL